MADHTAIEWTDATWNPVTGCSVVSAGCTNCYAMRLAGTRLAHHPSRAGLTRDTKAGPVWTGAVRLNEEWLDQPLRWNRPRKIFVCAHGDLFAEAVPDAWIDQVFAVMALAPHHTFQVLTKRPKRMREYLSRDGNVRRIFELACDMVVVDQVPAVLLVEGIEDPGLMPSWPRVRLGNWPIPNVWLGVSVEDQERSDERIPELLETPAALRFVSAEPLLGPINFTEVQAGEGKLNALTPFRWEDEIESWRGTSPDWEEAFLDWYQLSALPEPGPMYKGLDWVIIGGESGQGARPMHPDWARSIRDQCHAAGVPFFFKQWGAWLGGGPGRFHSENCRDLKDWGDGHYSALVTKKTAGRLLDGDVHDGFPQARDERAGP